MMRRKYMPLLQQFMMYLHPDLATIIKSETIEKVAEAAHTLWVEGMLHDGWAYSHKADPHRKLHPNLKPYSELDEEDKKLIRNLVVYTPERIR